MSKPPGRRLVTAEIHNYLVQSWHFMTATFYTTFVLRIVMGYFSFNIVFACIEMSKISMVMSLSILNVSSFLQISLMLNSRTIQIDDKEKTYLLKCLAVNSSLTSPDVCEVKFFHIFFLQKT